MGCEEMQQAEFSCCYAGGLSAHSEGHGVTMQFEIGSGNAGSQRLLKTPQHRPDTRCKFASPERFGDVIVGPKVQAPHSVFFTCPRSQKNDGNAGKIVVFTDLAADFKAAVTWNHDVQQEESRRILTCQGQYFVAGNAKAHVEPGQLQVVAHQV